jgi:LPXTG-motif cell wall-anchored protein
VEGDVVKVASTGLSGGGEVWWRIGLPRVELSAAKAAPGARLQALGVNFQPGERVSATMFSNPVLVGHATADADGRVELAWSVPRGAAPGAHHLELSGSLAGAHRAAFQVEASGDGPGLPFTGGDAGHRILGAAALLLAGLAALGLRRRERIQSGLVS